MIAKYCSANVVHSLKNFPHSRLLTNGKLIDVLSAPYTLRGKIFTCRLTCCWNKSHHRMCILPRNKRGKTSFKFRTSQLLYCNSEYVHFEKEKNHQIQLCGSHGVIAFMFRSKFFLKTTQVSFQTRFNRHRWAELGNHDNAYPLDSNCIFPPSFFSHGNQRR